ncbi:hypothetical protein D9611_002767 [Ephemerocybe angulata]|uniref:Thioesterase domain-containing protein n=1 Tax=Ephemerocybe angulata TaxID=980116 RepID=A0A8H5C1S0_9AGAR|nr:hypothetical protein D9611_002767 [Tulosesus angulatus]
MSRTIDVSAISGNAPVEVKEFVGDVSGIFANNTEHQGPLFGEAIQDRLRVTEVSINQKAEAPKKLEGRVVIETIIEEDMLNGGGNIHGGCSAFLIDICSTLALAALSLATTQKLAFTVSQSLNVVYHSPAGLGDHIRIVNQTLTLGARAQSVRSEIWSVTHGRLVASGTHIKLQPSSPPSPKANL